MPSHRIIVLALVLAGGIIAAGLGALLLTRDDSVQVTGDLIAYGCREPNKAWFALCVIRVDGTDHGRLTRRLPTSGSAWSPGGSQIAFTRHQVTGESTGFTDDDVFVVDADGDDVQQLTEERPGTHSGQPAWSPDGREIAFIRGPSLAAGLGQPGSILVMPADGGPAIRRLTNGALDSGPAWSPDGRWIAFSRAKDFFSPREIWIVGATGGEPRQLTKTVDLFDTVPAWSPDGSTIAFVRTTPQRTEYDGKSTIYAMNRDGTGLELLIPNQHFARSPLGLAWSPDGTTIAFETSPTRVCTAISLLVVESRAVRPLTRCTKPRESAISPAWQPNADAGDR